MSYIRGSSNGAVDFHSPVSVLLAPAALDVAAAAAPDAIVAVVMIAARTCHARADLR